MLPTLPCTPLQTYIMKLARSGEDGEKVHVVLESGVRFHTTQVCDLAKQYRHASHWSL